MRLFKSWLSSLSKRHSPRSNGMRIRYVTATHIRSANMFRTQQDWLNAASAYRNALIHEPHLQHIWVQLGHVEKEGGEIDRAQAAYEEAARLAPDDAEPLLHLGHMAKAWRQPLEAAEYFIKALRRDRTDLQAFSELVRLMPDCDDMSAAIWLDVFSVLGIEPIKQPVIDKGEILENSIILDVTDLIAFFGKRRLPTGIQRVQIEISLSLLNKNDHANIIFCIYSIERRGWINLRPDYFKNVCRLSKQSDNVADPIWTSQLYLMYCEILTSKTVIFSPATLIINLGTSWSDRNYLLDIRTIRARHAVLYVPLVFDLIPLIEPNWFTQSLVLDYRSWFGSLLHSADGCLAISHATCHDLLQKSAQWNAYMTPDSVAVVPLDGDFRQASASVDILQAYGLKPQSYVLMVSTLEPRKNHKGAFKAWLALADKLGEAAIPHLVCVGGRGWLNEDLHQMLRENPALQRLVHILHGVPDDRLAALYEHCLFTLYPSFYEGWGLPVSESLSYGKVPAISCVSSLPEAGGRYACYFDPENPTDIAAKVYALLDNENLNRAEAAIAQDYVPQTWHDIAMNLVAQAKSIAPRIEDALVRIAGAGVWTLTNNPCGGNDDDNEQQGEALRFGHAWLTPTATGCRIQGDDAALWFHWAGLPDAEMHIYCITSRNTRVNIDFNGSSRLFEIAVGKPTVIPCSLPKVAGPLRIAIVPVTGEITVEKIMVTH